MKDVIIPVDFSETSLNAARYAAAMLSGKPEVHVVLYTMFTDEAESDNAGQYLESLRNELLAKGVANHIEVVKEYGEDLIDCLARLAYQKNAELIVMGISEKEEWKQVFMGSNTIRMAEQNVCPVMIIPPVAEYKGIKQVALTSDFHDVESSTPVGAIKPVLELFNPGLHIVNVSSEHYVSLTEEYQAGKAKMQELFADFNPEFYFIGMNDYQEAIQQFATDHGIDLIIVIPRNHSFFQRLMGENHTKKLAFHSNIPILAAHE